MDGIGVEIAGSVVVLLWRRMHNILAHEDSAVSIQFFDQIVLYNVHSKCLT